MLGTSPKASDLVGLEWALGINIPSKFPGDPDATGWGPHLENHWFRVLGTPLLRSEGKSPALGLVSSLMLPIVLFLFGSFQHLFFLLKPHLSHLFLCLV